MWFACVQQNSNKMSTCPWHSSEVRLKLLLLEYTRYVLSVAHCFGLSVCKSNFFVLFLFYSPSCFLFFINLFLFLFFFCFCFFRFFGFFFFFFVFSLSFLFFSSCLSFHPLSDTGSYSRRGDTVGRSMDELSQQGLSCPRERRSLQLVHLFMSPSFSSACKGTSNHIEMNLHL